jgi:acyl-CoA thioester hydrolase
MRKHGVLEATVEAHVAFHDVDVAGIVWHGHYLKYLENARWALMDRLIEVHVKYVQAARFGDRLAVQASLVEWENRLTINYLVKQAATQERVARARTVQVAVEASTGVLQFATPAVLLERVAAATRGAKWNDVM